MLPSFYHINIEFVHMCLRIDLFRVLVLWQIKACVYFLSQSNLNHSYVHQCSVLCVFQAKQTNPVDLGYLRQRGGTVDPAHVRPDSVETYSPWATDLLGGETNPKEILTKPSSWTRQWKSRSSLQQDPGEDKAQCNASLAHRSFGYLPSNQACRRPPDSRSCIVRNFKIQLQKSQNFPRS